MGKKILAPTGTLLLVFVLLATATAATVLFLYPYEPKQPPMADDSGWTQQGVQEVVNANNRFALELYSELSKREKGNIFYSPYSIFSVFAMTFEGANGQTAEEIKSVFHFPEYHTLRPNFARIYNDINEASDAYELRTGNALWVQQSYLLLENYTSKVERYYGGKAANLDFANETEKSRQTINNFIEEQTDNKIEELIPQRMLNPVTRLVLTNAIYFKGTWKWEFDPKNTREMEFYVTPTNAVKVPMMYMKPGKARFNYTDLGDLQILELPYKGDKISMLIILPNNISEVEHSLTLGKLEEWKNQMRETKFSAIYLPKFEFSTKYFMKDTLSAMGMSTVFSDEADFSRMTGKKSDLFINLVIHQAYVKVDEEGTEAAAATAVGVVEGVPDIFKADHPFIFIIQQKDTGNILFLGRVMDPTK